MHIRTPQVQEQWSQALAAPQHQGVLRRRCWGRIANRNVGAAALLQPRSQWERRWALRLRAHARKLRASVDVGPSFEPACASRHRARRGRCSWYSGQAADQVEKFPAKIISTDNNVKIFIICCQRDIICYDDSEIERTRVGVTCLRETAAGAI